VAKHIKFTFYHFMNNSLVSSIFVILCNHPGYLVPEFSLVGPGFELRTLHFQSRHSTASPPVHFALVILGIGLQELFSQAGLKLQPSKSLPPK
jgi:hypothetical protein